MLYVNVVIILASAVLAILSRKHFSKYKDREGILAGMAAVCLAMGHKTWMLLGNILPLEGLRDKLSMLIRKSQVVSPKRLEMMVDKFIAQALGLGLGIIFMFNLVDLGIFIHNYILNQDYGNLILREEYGGDAKNEEIYYQLSGQEEVLVLNVSPVRLGQEQFRVKASEVAEGIKAEYFAEGTIISQDIKLPSWDDSGVFDISWESDTPEILSSRGRIQSELPEKPVEVRLKMIISYYDYSEEYMIPVMVGREEKTPDERKKEDLAQALNNLEQQTVENKELVLPDEMCDVKIKVKNHREDRGSYLGLGFILAVAVVGISISRTKEAGQRRDMELMREYPYFVDSLWLYIESGMNMQRAIGEYVCAMKDRKGTLSAELQVTLNQIGNGQAEYTAYEELGGRLKLPVYASLMRHVSQNIKMGTKDLRLLMEQEVTIALEAKKEAAKRLGEEASTKLIFPMIVLLVVVMMIIMTPAFLGF